MTISSSIVTTLGAGSGVDMASLAQQLAVAQFAGRNQQLTKKSEVLERQISAASTIKNMMAQLSASLGERVRVGDLSPQPQIANAGVATVSSPTGQIGSGSYSLEVLNLATSQTLAMPPVTPATSTYGAGTLTLRFGTATANSFTEDASRPALTIAIPEGATLSAIASTINAQQSGVTAYVAQTTAGAQLVFKGAEGEANGFIVEGAGETPGDPAYAALSWNPNAGPSSAQLTTASSNARFRLDGLEMTSATNTTGAIAPGLQLTLRGTNQGAPTQVTFNNPSSTISSAMQDLVDALNAVVSELNAAANPLGGDLARDSGARALRQSLAALGSEVVMPQAAPGSPRTLSDLGLALQRDGSFRLDTQRLQATLTRDPAGTAAMFTPGLYGVYATIDRISRAATGSSNPTSLAASLTRYEKLSAQVTKDSAILAEKQEDLRANLAARYAKTDSRVSASQATLTFLKAQIDAWNAQKN